MKFNELSSESDEGRVTAQGKEAEKLNGSPPPLSRLFLTSEAFEQLEGSLSRDLELIKNLRMQKNNIAYAVRTLMSSLDEFNTTVETKDTCFPDRYPIAYKEALELQYLSVEFRAILENFSPLVEG